MIRTSGTCARCGKAFMTEDGDTMREDYGPLRGQLVHWNPYICIRYLSEDNAALKAKVEGQEGIIERLSDQYTDAVLAAEEMRVQYEVVGKGA